MILRKVTWHPCNRMSFIKRRSTSGSPHPHHPSRVSRWTWAVPAEGVGGAQRRQQQGLGSRSPEWSPGGQQGQGERGIEWRQHEGPTWGTKWFYSWEKLCHPYKRNSLQPSRNTREKVTEMGFFWGLRLCISGGNKSLCLQTKFIQSPMCSGLHSVISKTEHETWWIIQGLHIWFSHSRTKKDMFCSFLWGFHIWFHSRKWFLGSKPWAGCPGRAWPALRACSPSMSKEERWGPWQSLRTWLLRARARPGDAVVKEGIPGIWALRSPRTFSADNVRFPACTEAHQNNVEAVQRILEMGAEIPGKNGSGQDPRSPHKAT